MLSAISFGVFWRSAPSTSAIIRSRKVSPGSRGDAHDDLVGEHAGAAGHGRPVATRFADHRRGFAGDGRLVDRRDALDDLTVRRHHLAGGHDHDVVDGQLRRGHDLDAAVGPAPVRHGLGARLAQGGRLRLAAPLGHRFGEVGEQHGEPQPRGDEAGEEVLLRGRAADVADEQERREHRADQHDEHDRVAGLQARVELAQAVDARPADDARLEQRPLRCAVTLLGCAGWRSGSACVRS